MVLEGVVDYIRDLVTATPNCKGTVLAHAQGLDSMGCHLALKDGKELTYYYIFKPDCSLADTVLAAEKMLQDIGRDGGCIHFPQPIIGYRILVD